MKKLPLIIIALFVITAVAPAFAQEAPPVNILFNNFPWGTSLQDFKTKMGEPVNVENNNGLQSLVYDNVNMSGYPAYMVAYFSPNGLQGGTYYFKTKSVDELMRCYTRLQGDLRAAYGHTLLYESLLREMRVYETSWNLPSGYIYLKINTRWLDEPVTLWYSSPELTKMLRQ
ncbi:MAG: hypothetical protein FWB73_07970 [Treponema sp.]|nr:hypothetical protein [Treponema sp.]